MEKFVEIIVRSALKPFMINYSSFRLNRLFTLLSVILISIFPISSKIIEISELDLLSEDIRKSTGNRYIEYTISKNIDLNNDTLNISEKSKIIINGGIIKNGILHGNCTELITKTFPVFNNIRIEGSWIITNISTDMFESVDKWTLANISNLSSDKYYNTIEINEDCLTPIKPKSSYFQIKSNTRLILNADIYTLPTEFSVGYCIGVSGENISIKGNNHSIYGTIANTDQTICREWLHGLNIDRESKDIEVEDLNSQLFCGDGFYNAGSNIKYKNIHAKFNGRQGLSITNGVNILVENSSFGYTGFFRMFERGPGAGIDIEPNKGDSVSNIVINNCRFSNNYREKRNLSKDIHIFKSFDGKIIIKDCSFEGLYLGSCTEVKILQSSQFKIHKINSDIRIFD